MAESSKVTSKKIVKCTMSITANFKLWDDKPRVELNSEDKVIFESNDVPLTKTAIILLLIMWQVAVFNFTARKENLRELRE